MVAGGQDVNCSVVTFPSIMLVRIPANTLIARILRQNSGMTYPLTAEMLHVSPANREWVDRRCVPQALATFEMPILLSGKIENVKHRLYISDSSV
jgi:hypothetical protein